MTCQSTIELKDWTLETHIGTFAPDESPPHAHRLDMRLWVDPTRVLIAEDGMSHVFDYDPLIREIERLGGECHYETQERLLTRIAQACAMYLDISAVDLTLRKSPLQAGIGSLGIRLFLDGPDFEQLRKPLPTPHLHRVATQPPL